jgi:hypothetical protein
MVAEHADAAPCRHHPLGLREIRSVAKNCGPRRDSLKAASRSLNVARGVIVIEVEWSADQQQHAALLA